MGRSMPDEHALIQWATGDFVDLGSHLIYFFLPSLVASSPTNRRRNAAISVD